MSDNKRNINSSIGKTLDYLRDLLGGKERNALERNLEKDAFEREAMEGFQSIHPNDLEADLNVLNKNLSRRVSKSSRALVYRIAAGIAIILSLSMSYLLVFDKQIDKFPENLKVSERVEKADKVDDKSVEISDEVSKRMDDGNMDDDISEAEFTQVETDSKIEKSQTFISEGEKENLDIIPQEEIAGGFEDEKTTEITMEFAEENEVAVALEINRVGALKSNTEEASGQKAEAVPAPVSEVYDAERVTQTAASRAKKSVASPSVLREESEVTADEVGPQVLSNSVSAIYLEEVVFVDTLDAKSDIDYTPAEPETGMRKYRKYIEENIHIQDTVTEKNRSVVILTFIITEKGKPEQFRIIESPDTVFSKEAIRLIEEGPLWIPAKRLGYFSTEETRLKIVFKN